MSQQQYNLSRKASGYELPDFTLPIGQAVKRLTGLDLETQQLASELQLRTYSTSEAVFVVVREAVSVLRDEYQLLIEQAERSAGLQFFHYLAGMRDRATQRVNARLGAILAGKLPAVPVWTVEREGQRLDLSDKLLPASRGYKLKACELNKRAVGVQIEAGPIKQLEPGDEALIPANTERVLVFGVGQTMRASRVPPPERSGGLSNALVMVANRAKPKPAKRSLWARLRRASK